MRTLIIIAGGLVLLGLFVSDRAMERAGTARCAAVLHRAVVDGGRTQHGCGVARAGYSVAEELPIFLLIFAVPSRGALLLNWWSVADRT